MPPLIRLGSCTLDLLCLYRIYTGKEADGFGPPVLNINSYLLAVNILVS